MGLVFIKQIKIDAGWRGRWDLPAGDPNLEYIIELLEDCDADYTVEIVERDNPEQLELPF